MSWHGSSLPSSHLSPTLFIPPNCTLVPATVRAYWTALILCKCKLSLNLLKKVVSFLLLQWVTAYREVSDEHWRWNCIIGNMGEAEKGIESSVENFSVIVLGAYGCLHFKVTLFNLELCKKQMLSWTVFLKSFEIVQIAKIVICWESITKMIMNNIL